jgi:hypothetical protein
MNRTFSTVVFQNSGSVSRCQSDRRTAKYLRLFEEFNNEIQILLCSDDAGFQCGLLQLINQNLNLLSCWSERLQ